MSCQSNGVASSAMIWFTFSSTISRMRLSNASRMNMNTGPLIRTASGGLFFAIPCWSCTTSRGTTYKSCMPSATWLWSLYINSDTISYLFLLSMKLRSILKGGFGYNLRNAFVLMPMVPASPMKSPLKSGANPYLQIGAAYLFAAAPVRIISPVGFGNTTSTPRQFSGTRPYFVDPNPAVLFDKPPPIVALNPLPGPSTPVVKLRLYSSETKAAHVTPHSTAQ